MLEIINYAGWPNCARIYNDTIELIVTLDVGPRVIRLGLPGGQNLMKEFAPDLGHIGGDLFRFYGGHRFWHSPEHPTRTYHPDNQPVRYNLVEGGLRITPAPETINGLQKEIEIRLAPDSAQVEVLHRLTNIGPWALHLAPWALTACAPGGTAIVPLPPRGPHTAQLLPTNTLALWAYTDLSDPRWTLGRDHILLRQDTAHPSPQKLGALVPNGWAAYALNDDLLVKHFTYQPNAPYPDFGCSVEIFTNGEMLEVESLGPLTDLQPGTSVEHTETWRLFHDPALPAATQNGTLWPLVQSYAVK